ncbi:hypothetical protein IFR04_013099 [Cadophora malorum]|uniref:Alpha-galactosidase n=1 Tax=Cadophora malorum TaxID=108018 RepID=A0A8H7T217_9HELO|nr:hypothetical protein IFR04_013099 [Cadophora malorum]
MWGPTALLQGGVCKTATSPSTTSTTTPVPTPSTTPGLSNGLALTLPMEWSSWNRFGDQIDEPLIKNTMDTWASNGLRDIGYVSINLDDGWQRYKSNRSHNPLELDPEKFPSGMKALADYAHANGFKLGIYSDAGANQWQIGQDISDDFMYPENREKYYFDVLDMLDRGNDLVNSQLVGTGASTIEYRTHLSILNAYASETLSNKSVIAVNQNPLGISAEIVGVGENEELQVYAKEMSAGSYAVELLTRGSFTAEMSVSPRRELLMEWDTCRVRDVWKQGGDV